MKKQSFGKPLCRVMMAVAIMLLSLQAMAYDFSYTHQGKTLYYKILAGGTNTLAVTYYSETAASNNHVSGDVVIPSSVEHNNVTYSVTSIGDSAFYGCSDLTSVSIPNSVTSIGSSAFRECSGLTSVSIPNSVTSIGNIAFSDCRGLTSVALPNSVTSIGYSAFYHCSGLTSITIPNNVTSIASNTFSGCRSLTSVTIPYGVGFIGNYAFFDCRSLTSITIPNSVSHIGYAAFHACNSLNSINVPLGNGYFSSIDGVLYDNPRETLIQCPGARTSLTIPNSVTTIGESAFIYCHDLTSVTIPNSVTSIGRGAFYRCNSLTSIKCLAAVPPLLDTISLFFNIPDTCTLTVPCGSLEAYTTSDWNTYFATRISEDLSFELSVSANDETYGRVAFEAQSCEVAIITATPNEGYEFTRWNDGNTENPRTVTITSDTAFMAIFTEAVSTPTITLTVNNEAMGSASYTMDGNTAVLTATANEGYSFLTWSDGNMENPRTVTITSDTAFMAIFTEAVSTPTITLTVNNEAMGSASYTMDGNTAVLTATANEGYSFLTWSDGNMENPRTVTITSDTAFMAIFTASSSSSLQEVNAREFALYPNPAKSFVTLEFEALKENTLLQILDLNGRKVRTFDLKAGQETLRIEIGNLPEGVYTVMLGNTAKKLIVE